MPWDRPTLQQLHERISRDFSGRLLDGGRLLSRSVIAVFAKVWSGACHHMHGLLAWLYLQVFVDVAEGPYLERWARIWGVFRKIAAYAAGYALFTGTDGAVIPAGTLMQHLPTGLRYAARSDAVVSGGTANVDIRAILPGAASNLPPGASLALIAPLAGLHSLALAGPDGISGGADEEDDESLRSRLLKLLRDPPHGGSKADYEQWALSVPGVTRAFVYPLHMGPGTVGVTFLTDTMPSPIPTPEMIARVREKIDQEKPVTAIVEVFAPEVLPITVAVKVTPDTAAIRSAVRREIEDLWQEMAAPGSRIFPSRIQLAIGLAPGVRDFALISPVSIVDTDAGIYPYLALEFLS